MWRWKGIEVFIKRGFRVVTGGTDSHIVWLDLSPKNLTGDKAEKLLEDVGIACNKNAIPYDPHPPKITSGIRFGTAATTSRGFNNKDFEPYPVYIMLLSTNEWYFVLFILWAIKSINSFALDS